MIKPEKREVNGYNSREVKGINEIEKRPFEVSSYLKHVFIIITF